jgi:hypothetical protein
VFGLSIIKHVTSQKIVAHDFRYDPSTICDQLLNELSLLSFDAMAVLLASQYTIFFFTAICLVIVAIVSIF